MEKSITLFFGKVDKNGDYKRRLDLIKHYGYDRFMTTVGHIGQNSFLHSQVSYAKKIGLKLSSLHSKYDASTLHYFWEEGIKGERICRDLMRQLKLAHKYGFSCLVVHTLGPNTTIGLERFKRMLKLANKLNTPIAVENILNDSTFRYLFKNLGDDDMLKVCYDSGHEHFSLDQQNFLEENIDKVVCLHLHDNFGRVGEGNFDRHSFIGDGNIDWDRVAKLLSTKDLPLDVELLMHYEMNYSYDELLSKAMDGAKMLEKKIEKYKKENAKKSK